MVKVVTPPLNTFLLLQQSTRKRVILRYNTLVNEELVLAGVEHALADVPVEEGVRVVPLHRQQLLPQVELAAPRSLARRPREAPSADVGDDGPQWIGAQLLDVAREVEAGAVQQLRLLLGQGAPVKEIVFHQFEQGDPTCGIVGLG